MQGFNFKSGLVSRAESSLCLLDLTSKLLDGPLVTAHVLATLLLEDLHEVLHDALVEVLATQVGVSVGGYNFKHAIVNGQQAHIKGTTAQVIHEDVLLGLLVQPICNGSSCGLVDNTEHIKTSNEPCILGGLPLRIVEVSWNSDHRMFHLLSEIILSHFLHLGENHG
mmetsp:Transcript_6918/g.16789  ORF Transcript_6918/g.16789 Transcript_6918/m.16789 type:complete len:167 (+) Transcript_6918:1108-1608(+)